MCELHTGLAHPVAGRIVGVAVVPGRGHDIHAGGLGDRAHFRRSATQTDGRDLDDSLQPAALGGADLFDRVVGVIELLAWKCRGA